MHTPSASDIHLPSLFDLTNFLVTFRRRRDKLLLKFSPAYCQHQSQFGPSVTDFCVFVMH